MSEIVNLIQHWEEFKVGNPQGTIQQFALWVLQNASAATKEAEQVSGQPYINVDHAVFKRPDESRQLSGQAAYLIARLNRYTALYSKPVMQKHNLNSNRDFGFLATIDYAGTIGKKELCEHTLTEVTTGMDIIRRLKEAGYVHETGNPQDKRARLLALTPKGKTTLLAIYSDFEALPDVLANLPLEDRKVIVTWLRNLESFHNACYKNSKE